MDAKVKLEGDVCVLTERVAKLEQERSSMSQQLQTCLRYTILGGGGGSLPIQYKLRLSSYAKRIWFLANAFAPALGNTQTRLELL